MMVRQVEVGTIYMPVPKVVKTEADKVSLNAARERYYDFGRGLVSARHKLEEEWRKKPYLSEYQGL